MFDFFDVLFHKKRKMYVDVSKLGSYMHYPGRFVRKTDPKIKKLEENIISGAEYYTDKDFKSLNSTKKIPVHYAYFIKYHDSFLIFDKSEKQNKNSKNITVSLSFSRHIEQLTESKMNRILQQMPDKFSEKLFQNSLVEVDLKEELKSNLKNDDFKHNLEGIVLLDDCIHILYCIKIDISNVKHKKIPKESQDFIKRNEIKELKRQHFDNLSKVIIDKIKLNII